MSKVIRVVLALPRTPAVVREIDDSLSSLQGLVGGNLEGFYALQPLRELGLHVYVNEGGKALGLETNCLLGEASHWPGDSLVGPIVVSRAVANGEEVGLSKHEAVFAVGFLDRFRAGQGLLTYKGSVGSDDENLSATDRGSVNQ